MAERVLLCAAAALEEAGTAHVWDLLEHGQPARGFALRFDGVVRGYLNRCLHVPVEMDWNPGEFLGADRRTIVCSIHGAEYEPETGQCVGGPCGRGRLAPLDLREEGGQVYWYPAAPFEPASSPQR
jgi:nitrite reductase/ring-hydroxylating ferredoxin subunit